MAQEVSFMMLRVAMFSIFHKYRLRLIPGFEVKPKPIVTLSPIAIQVTRMMRENKAEREAMRAARFEAAELAAQKAAAAKLMQRQSSLASEGGLELVLDPSWDVVRSVPKDSKYPKLTIGFGSNFGTSKEVANRFLDATNRFGLEGELTPLNNLIEAFRSDSPPNMLHIVTPTYTGQSTKSVD